jgi:hypothetical protein
MIFYSVPGGPLSCLLSTSQGEAGRPGAHCYYIPGCLSFLVASGVKRNDPGLEMNFYPHGVTKRCRLSWLTNSALVYEPKCGGGGVTGSQSVSTAVHRSPNKLWRSNSIFYLWLSCSRRTELSVIYQNRAAASERLEDFELALQDLQASIDLNNRSAYAFYFQNFFTEAYSHSFGVDPKRLQIRFRSRIPPSSDPILKLLNPS